MLFPVYILVTNFVISLCTQQALRGFSLAASNWVRQGAITMTCGGKAPAVPFVTHFKKKDLSVKFKPITAWRG